MTNILRVEQQNENITHIQTAEFVGLQISHSGYYDTLDELATAINIRV